VLAERQIDCDVVCIDTLLDPLLTRIGAGSFTVNRETFHCLVVPFAERLPLRFLGFLARLARAGIWVVFTRDAPIAASDGDASPGNLTALRAHPMTAVVPTEDLAETLRTRGIPGLKAQPDQPHLRTYRYCKRAMDLLFCFNEDARNPLDTRLFVDDARHPIGYDALHDALVSVEGEHSAEGMSVRLRLEPYESLFVVFPDDASTLPAPVEPMPFIGDLQSIATMVGPWKVAVSERADAPAFSSLPHVIQTGDLSLVPGLEGFSGTASYEAELVVPNVLSGGMWLDLGEVGESSEAWLDGRQLGTRICPPHRYALGSAGTGRHDLRIEVTTTLARRLGDNAFDRAMPQGPTGLIGPVRLLSKG
jgi:hypothetical protein